MTRSGADRRQPKLGAPYQVPALIIKDGGEPEADETEAREHSGRQRSDIERKHHGLPRPARLPTTGARARRPPAATGALVHLIQVVAETPREIAPEDTASMINDLATEIIASADIEIPKPIGQEEEQPDKGRKHALYFVVAAALLSVIVAVLPSRTIETNVELDAQTLTAEQKDSAETPAAPPTQVDLPRGATDPGPFKPAPESEPTLSGPRDKRSHAELYTAAIAAYDGGQAAEAHRLAFISWRRKNKSKTAELLTLAACKMKDHGKASSSLKMVTPARRGAVKGDCSAMGVGL